MRKISFLGGFLLLLACQPGPNSGQPSSGAYFSLKNYFAAEIERLNGLAGPFEKTVWVAGAPETALLDSIDFKGELKIFLESDINRPSWSDKYQVDSLLTPSGALQGLQYRAMDPKLNTREMEVRFENGAVSLITIRTLLSSAIATSEHWLEYDPDAGYEVRSEQATRGLEKNKVEIKVVF